MQPTGIAAFEKREENKSRIYAYEKERVKLDAEFEKKLKANGKASTFFYSQAPSYQKTTVHWVMNGKQEVTRISRLEKLTTNSEAGRKV